MEDLKKKINFDPSLLYYSPTSKDTEEDEKSPVTNVETYNSTNRKHVCTVCGKRFFSISALNVHMEHHPPNERSNVEKDDDNANSNRKNQYVWDNGIKCNKLECNFIALDAVEYSKHISSCEGTRLTKGGENISFCELCDSYFSSDNHFKAHLILQHPDCDPDISLKEYDAKYTTVSDPVSLYVSENSENDSDVRQAKHFSHSKYPDSSISKRKSKESENEEVLQKNQDTNKTMDEVTVVTSSIEANIVKVGVNELVLDTEEKSSEVSVSETLTNNKPHVQIENGKCEDENTEELTIQFGVEKSSIEQSEVSILNQNDTNVDSNTKDDNLIPVNSENTSTNNEISSKEKSDEEQAEVNNKPSDTSEVKKSDDKDVETKNEESSDKVIDEDVYNTEVPQTVSEEKKVEVDSIETDSKKVGAKENDDKQENYMNVEKMMYNLFKDEGTEVTPSQERGDIQDLNDGSPEKQKEDSEQNQSSNPLDSNKDESDFEDFDYTKAGKKKYLKSYSRLNKSKVDTNEEEKTNETIEIKEEAEAVEKNQSIGLDEEEPKKKKPVGRKRKQSLISETPVADLNIKERSTRTRKKLILPDFEYDSDYKSYTPDAPSRRSEIPKRPSLPKNDDSSPRKRGRPRKNQDLTLNSSDVDKSANTTDMSTNSANKSTAGVKSRIENSYLNASETSMKRDIADIKIKNSDSFNTSNSSVSESFSQDETSEAEKKPKLQATTKNTSEMETAKKKKRGRPKSKTPSEPKLSKFPPSSSTMDKNTEESICSDVANALLSLSDSVPRKETVAQKSTPASVLEKIDQVHIIKRKKMNTVKPVDSNATLKDDLENISTFELKNDLEGDLADVSGEIDTDLSFNDANKFEKEKESEENTTSFMKDLSSSADVSTPKKRGRPPKARKGPKLNASSQKTPVSGSQVPSKPKLSKSLPTDGEKRTDKIFDTALSDRKSVFLKNKAKMNNEFRKELNSTLPITKKKGRPAKSLPNTSTKQQSSLFTNQPIKKKVKKQAIIPHGARPIHDIRIDEPDAPKPIKEKPAVKITVSKKKKKRLGRPPKSASTDTSLQKEDTSKTSEKDLNLNELTSSRRARENSPFIYESYHPKKKRARLDIGNQDAEKAASASKTDEHVPKKVPKIPKPKKPPPPPPVEEPDETRNIDEELYLEDVKNRTKYGKLFKKVKSFIYDEKYTDDMIINCGRCKKKMTFRHYKNYHQLSHYYVSWIEGDQEINLQDDSDVVRHLQTAITPEALKKKAIRLACEKCNDVRKSVVGYVSHVRFCQKEDKNSLFETCKLCQKALRPSSVRFHYIKFHGCYKPSKGGMCFSDENDFFDGSQDLSKEDSDGTGTPLKKRFRMGFNRRELQKKDIVEDEEFWTELKTSCDLFMCMGLSCRHMAISKEELKAHVLECLSRFCEFSCSSCAYKTRYENEIIYHSKKKCQGETNDISIADLSSNRVTTRGKTLNFKFANDLNDVSDDEKKHTDRGDRDFEVGEDKTDDEDFEDSDMEFEKSSLRKSSKRKKSERSMLSTSVSDKLGLRNAFQQYCIGRADPLRWTVDLRLKLFSSTPLHVHMKISSKEWDSLPQLDAEKYIPVHRKSVKAYFDSGPASQFDLFQADVIKGVPLCYVGGPVWAMAWAPIPAHVTEQYLAVSTLQHMNHLVEINESVSFPSLIQFWKFSSLDNISNDIQKPILGWSIAHSYGAVWSMEWCPSGGFNNLSTTTRLGILAAATSSGCVVIYNIPKLEAGDKEPKEMVTNPKPDLILKIRNDNVQCTRIVWDQISPHNSLIGGFSDGSIAFWNINTASVLLKKGNVIYPYRTFDAHNSPITALDLHWLNNSRYLLTGSMNRVTRHWDLNDLSGPINEYERPTPVMNAAWMQHWIVTANVHDFGNLVGESGAFIAHPRDPFEKKKTIMNIRDAFWSLSYSLWNDTVAVSSNGGYVSTYAAKHLSMLTFKSPDFEKTITSTELVDLNDEEKKNFNSEELTDTMPSSNDLLDCTPIIKSNGIRFSDRAKNNMNSETLSFDLEKCNPTSVNKVCWNQNYNSFNWLAIGYECGFVRVIRVERFDKHYLTKFYKTNENTATLM